MSCARSSDVRELVASHEVSQRANWAESQVLAAASHDLRQLVHTLKLFNGALESSVRQGSEAAKVVAGQAKTLDSMADLLGSLLDLAALDADVMVPAICDFPVERIFARLRTEFELEAASRGLTLAIEESDYVIRTDPCLVERTVRNLLANAIRYTYSGEVRVRCVRKAKHVRIEVRDTGIGIPADQLKAIFAEYHQVNPRASAISGGIGLGLAIVRRFADSLGHPLDVRSKPDEGSCFALTIPEGRAPTQEGC